MYCHAVQGDAKLSCTHKPWSCPPQLHGWVESITKIKLPDQTKYLQSKARIIAVSHYVSKKWSVIKIMSNKLITESLFKLLSELYSLWHYTARSSQPVNVVQTNVVTCQLCSKSRLNAKTCL